MRVNYLYVSELMSMETDIAQGNHDSVTDD
jgi:hypothetical protein